MTRNNSLNDIRDIQSRLVTFQDRSEAIEFEWSAMPVLSWSSGFVLHVGTDFVLISRISHGAYLNGYRAARLSTINSFDSLEHPKFIKRALLATSTTIPINPLPDANSFIDLPRMVHEDFPIVVMDDHSDVENPDSVAGRITSLHNGILRLREISLEGYWLTTERSLNFDHVSNLFFDSRYERTLGKVADLSDS